MRAKNPSIYMPISYTGFLLVYMLNRSIYLVSKSFTFATKIYVCVNFFIHLSIAYQLVVLKSRVGLFCLGFGILSPPL